MAAALGIAFCLISHFSLLHGIQLQISDNLFKAANLNPGADPTEDIVIVGIDDKSLDKLGQFSSWPRSYHAQIVNILAKSGARVIVFDVLFSEPSPDDEELAASIRNAGNVILPFVHPVQTHKSTAIGQTIAPEEAIRPLEVFEEGAIAVGHAVMFPDEDGIVRRLPLIIPGDDLYEPSLALTTIARYLRRSQDIGSPIRDNSLPFAGRAIPLDDSGNMLINYTDDAASPLNFNTVSYVDALREAGSSAGFQDKIVVIGVTATGLGDTFWTPMGRVMNGVDLHAAAMQTILSGNFLRPAPSIVAIVSILVLVILCGLAVLRLRVVWATLSAGFLCIIYFLTAFFLFDNGIIINMLHPPVAVVGTFAGMNIYNVIYERSEKMEITKIFGRYMSPPVVDKIIKALRGDELDLSGETQEITVLFVDVRHFTSISENIRSEAVVNTLNSYLNIIIETVLKYGGMISNFGGDSIMAIWNTPIKSEEHALLATKAAFHAQRAIGNLQKEKETLLVMEFGISVNTGEAVAGNMGSRDHLVYSVIGDAVNIASRLVTATPGGRVWIGADTYAKVKEHVTAKHLDSLSVKGRHEPVQAYEVLDIQDFQTVDAGNIYQSVKGKCNKS
jgi:adenylate cyclase